MEFWKSAPWRAGWWCLTAVGLLALAACSNNDIASFDPLSALASLGSPRAAAPATGVVGSNAAAPRAAGPIVALPAIGKLDDLTAAQLVSRIGEPDFRRVESPGELWQYRGAHCVLDVFLYGDNGAGAHVIHAEGRSRNLGGQGNCGDGADALRGHLREGQS
jgi:hypothetical protein